MLAAFQAIVHVRYNTVYMSYKYNIEHKVSLIINEIKFVSQSRQRFIRLL